MFLLALACVRVPKEIPDTVDTGTPAETDSPADSDTGEPPDTSDTDETIDTHDTSDTSPKDCEDGLIWDGEACVPEDCGTARFPAIPDGATPVYVDAESTGGAGTEGSPFPTLAEGLASVAAGDADFLALAGVTFHETIELTAAHTVTIAGRCPTLTVLDARAGEGDGVHAEGATFTMAHLTVSGAVDRGVVAREGSVTLEDVIVEGSLSTGIVVDGGATASLTGLVVDQNHEIGVLFESSGTTGTFTSSGITRTDIDARGVGGIGLSVQSGAVVEASGLVLSENHERGVQVRSRGATLTMSDSDIRGTLVRPDGLYGRGVEVADGGLFTCATCSIQDNAEAGVWVEGPGSEATLEESEVAATTVSAQFLVARGIAALDRGAFRMEGGTVTRNEGPGLHIDGGATVDLDGVRFEGDQFAEIVLEGGVLTGTRLTLLASVPDPTLDGGVGLLATGAGTGRTLDLSQVSSSGHPYAGIWIAARGGYAITDSTLEGNAGVDPGDGTRIHGNAVYATGLPTAWDGASGLLLSGDTFDGSLIGVLLDGASAQLDGSTWSANGLDLVQQACTDIDPVLVDVAPPTEELCPEAEYTTARLVWSVDP